MIQLASHHASASDPNLPNSVAKELPPPPYSGSGSRGRSASLTDVARRLPVGFQVPEERGSVNKITIHTKQQNIIGTYHVDPDLHVPDSCLLKSSNKCRKRKMKNLPPNATFKSKSGSIDLNLVITGRPDGVSKARVNLTSRSGDIAVNLSSLRASKHINLECDTRRGNVVVLLPKNYCGAIQLRSRKGHIKVLPALASIIRTVNSNPEEMLILMGDTGALGKDASVVADYCQLASRKGKITVGLSGIDSYVQETGMWKRLGEFLAGRG